MNSLGYVFKFKTPVRRVLLASISSLIAMAAAQTAQGQEPEVVPHILKYTDHEPLGGMRTRFLKEVLFANIEKESKGRIKIEDHWSGEIANHQGVLEAVGTKGTADIGVIVPEYFSDRIPKGQLFKSFLIGPTGQRQVNAFRQAFREIPDFEQELRGNGLTSLFLATGYPVAFYSTQPLSSLADITGQRWRTASFWHRDFLRNAAAQPVSIEWGPAVFDAMKSRDINGLMVNVDSGFMLNAHSVASNVLVSKELWLGHLYIVAINSNTWNKLSEDDRAAIQRAVETAYAQLGPTMDRSYDAMIGDLKNAGATVRELSHAEVEALGRSTRYRQVQERWASEQEAKGISGVQDTLERLRVIIDGSLRQN